MNQVEPKSSSCVAFLESMKEKIELMMKVGDALDDFSIHSLKSTRKKTNMDPKKFELLQQIRKDCEENGMSLRDASIKRGLAPFKVTNHAYTYGWDIKEFKSKIYTQKDKECRKVHERIVNNSCTIDSVIDDFNVSRWQYSLWRARQRAINQKQQNQD